MSNTQPSGISSSSGVLDLFESLADTVWDWLGNVRRLDLSFSEETITDLTALEIARYPSNLVKVKQVSKREERFVGFDWMWVIRRPPMRPAVYFVQAKKLKIKQSTPDPYSYGSLKYRVGGNYQIDVLEYFAHWITPRIGIDAKPLYCFYNNVDDVTAKSHWHCLQQQPPDVSQMGCTLVPLDAVRVVHDIPWGRKNFRSVHRDQRAVPWRCLFHPKCTDFGVHRTCVSPTRGASQGAERFESFLESISGEEALIDYDAMIQGLGLGEWVDRYATGNFRPIPERIATFNLAELVEEGGSSSGRASG